MKRRELLAAAAAVGVLGAARAPASEPHLPYSRELYEQALASGEPFMLDFFAPW